MQKGADIHFHIGGGAFFFLNSVEVCASFLFERKKGPPVFFIPIVFPGSRLVL